MYLRRYKKISILFHTKKASTGALNIHTFPHKKGPQLVLKAPVEAFFVWKSMDIFLFLLKYFFLFLNENIH